MSGLRLSWEDERKKHNSRKRSVPYLKKFYKIFEQRFFFRVYKMSVGLENGKDCNSTLGFHDRDTTDG